jgi:FkbM family methyltransferase
MGKLTPFPFNRSSKRARWAFWIGLFAALNFCPSPLLAKESKGASKSHFQVDGVRFYLPEHKTAKRQKKLAEGGEFYEKEMLQKLDSILPPNPVIIDIGSDGGIFCCYWGVKSKAERIIAFEPIEKNCATFQKNIELNKLQKVVTLNRFALSDEDGQLAVAQSDPRDSSETRLKKSGNGGPIGAKRLDSIRLAVDRIDLVVITVNGFEAQVLAGARETFARYKPAYLLIAIESGQTREVKRQLAEMGYVQEQQFAHKKFLYRRAID